MLEGGWGMRGSRGFGECEAGKGARVGLSGCVIVRLRELVV